MRGVFRGRKKAPLCYKKRVHTVSKSRSCGRSLKGGRTSFEKDQLFPPRLPFLHARTPAYTSAYIQTLAKGADVDFSLYFIPHNMNTYRFCLPLVEGVWTVAGLLNGRVVVSKEHRRTLLLLQKFFVKEATGPRKVR